MRKILFNTILLILTNMIYSQPGCVPEKSIEQSFILLSESINKNPYDYNLKWERIKVIQTNSCDKAIIPRPVQKNLIEYSRDSSVAYYKIDLLEELTTLINKDVKIDSHFDYLKYDKFNFYNLRGKEYLSQQDTLNALFDFNKTLETDDKSLQINTIEILSDFYLSKIKSWVYEEDKINGLKALEYIDKISPVEFTQSFTGNEVEPFTTKKINILKRLQNFTRLEKYLINLIKFQYHSIRTYDEFQVNSSTEYFFERIFALANFYFENKQYSKSKDIIEQLLNFKPDNQFNYVYNSTHRWAPKFDLLNKIYQTEEYKNTNLELDLLLKRMYADPFLNYSLDTEYVKSLLEKYPNDPRVYISWLYIKVKKGEEQTKENYSSTLSELFNKIESMNYNQFDLPYLKARYHYNINEFNLALNEINQALRLCRCGKLTTLKNEILRKMQNPNFVEIEKMAKEVSKNYFQYENLPELLNQVTKIASH